MSTIKDICIYYCGIWVCEEHWKFEICRKKGYARIDSFVMIDNTMQIVTAYLSI